MADWRDRFRAGTFRGVAFKTDSHSFSGGRRKVDHEFPQRDISRSEDMGRKMRRFSLELLVIGDDYFAQRDALIEALEKEGSGELIHPYLGRKTVQVGAFTQTETVQDGRLARFSVAFSETGDPLFPDATDSTLEKVGDAALIVNEKEKTAFENALDTFNKPAFVIQAAADAVGAAVDVIEDTVAKVTEPVANLTFAISNIKADINDLIKLPGELADRIQGLFSDLFAEFEDDPRTNASIMGAITGVSDAIEPVVGTTPSKDIMRANNDAIIDLVEITASATQSQSAVNIDFISNAEALDERALIIDNLNGKGEDDDELFQSIKDLTSALTIALPPDDVGEIIIFTPKKTLPALVIVHTLFQDLDKEAELIEQNSIAHPGFVPGGDPIEVSSD